MTRAPARRRALAALGRRSRSALATRPAGALAKSVAGSPRVGRFLGVWTRVVAPAGGALAFLVADAAGSLRLGVLMGTIVIVTLMALPFVGIGIAELGALLLRGLGRAWAALTPGERPEPAALPDLVPIDDLPAPPPIETVEVRGIVHARRPCTSPLAHQACVAYRVVGEGPLGRVDDAGAVPFDVETEDGRTVRVEPNAAFVALDVTAEPILVHPDTALTDFLDERGVFPERGPVRLAEAVLRDGEGVVIEGASDRTRETDGYRGAHEVERLRERPGAPLRIRRP